MRDMGTFLSDKKLHDFADLYAKQMQTKMVNVKQHVSALSGGNKQKVVFSKWLGTDCDVFILDCPTRGIDVGVKADMYKLIMELKRQGKGIIMISEELLELTWVGAMNNIRSAVEEIVLNELICC